MAPITLGYWGIRGLAEPLRYVLHYVKADFEDKHYNLQPTAEGGFDASEWTSVKPTLPVPFANLPYYIDDASGVRISQSDAILRHLGRKHGLYGKTDAQAATVDMLVDVGKDISVAVVRCVYSADFETLVVPLREKTIPTFVSQLSEFLGAKTWFAGDELTIADFILYERLDLINAVLPGCVTSNAALSAFMQRFAALPGVAEYVNSDAHKRLAWNNKIAKWGATGN